MYMETRAHLNYWSTENFCGRWTLKTGTLIIVAITTVGWRGKGGGVIREGGGGGGG